MRSDRHTLRLRRSRQAVGRGAGIVDARESSRQFGRLKWNKFQRPDRGLRCEPGITAQSKIVFRIVEHIEFFHTPTRFGEGGSEATALPRAAQPRVIFT